MPLGASGGVYFLEVKIMREEPRVKRAIAFIDGQNLYHAARKRFGAKFPNYDAEALARAVCTKQGWELTATRFYTGVHSIGRNPIWHLFWHKKFAVMRRQQNVAVISRQLMYVNEKATSAQGIVEKRIIALEKGIDLCLGLDATRLARLKAFDVALIFSQDQDFAEVADEVRAIGAEQNRWIKIASAFPQAAGTRERGINRTDWLAIDLNTYLTCLDSRDYYGAARRETSNEE
jgi:uncharacterized LabA/DUF88 family protein